MDLNRIMEWSPMSTTLILVLVLPRTVLPGLSGKRKRGDSARAADRGIFLTASYYLLHYSTHLVPWPQELSLLETLSAGKGPWGFFRPSGGRHSVKPLAISLGFTSGPWSTTSIPQNTILRRESFHGRTPPHQPTPYLIPQGLNLGKYQ